PKSYIDRINGAAAAAGGAASAQPSDARVRVLNGTGRTGLAGDVSVALHAVGFNIADRGDADAFKYTRTLIRYAPNELGKAQLLQRFLAGGAQLQSDPTLRSADDAVVVGSDYSGARAKPAPAQPGDTTPTTTGNT